MSHLNSLKNGFIILMQNIIPYLDYVVKHNTHTCYWLYYIHPRRLDKICYFVTLHGCKQHTHAWSITDLLSLYAGVGALGVSAAQAKAAKYGNNHLLNDFKMHMP